MSKVVLSTVLKSHKFDEMNVDTKLAEQYLETNKSGYRGNCSKDTENLEFVLDSYGNKIYCDIKDIPKYQGDLKYQCKPPAPVMPEELKKLAVEIEKNTDLFCQLELLIRKIPTRDTKISVNLIVRYLHYVSENATAIPLKKIVFVGDETPLLILGSVTKLLNSQDFTLIASKETAVICYCFYHLCHKMSFNFKFSIGDNIPNEAVHSYPSLIDDIPIQTIGIITEKSDFDSAISAFLDTDYHLFRVTRILVQESIYAEVKDTLEWKCKPNEDKSKINTDKFTSQCTQFFNYNNKLFLLDFVGNIEEVNNEVKSVVIVEAYRTTTDLLSLINKSTKRRCISLWASGISEANEIALNIDAPFIWINDYCNFVGPNEISRVLFEEILVNRLEICDELFVELKQKQKVWSKNSFTERCDKVLELLNSNDIMDLQFGKWFTEEIPNLKINNFVSVINDTMILGFYQFDDIFGFNLDDYINALRALVNGSAIYIEHLSETHCPGMFTKLAEAGLPVAASVNKDSKSKLPKTTLNRAHTKIIWMNYGTKFAN